MLRTGFVPRTLCTSSPDPSIRFPLVYREPVRANPRRILVNCQSYEGQAASLILEAVTELNGANAQMFWLRVTRHPAYRHAAVRPGSRVRPVLGTEDAPISDTGNSTVTVGVGS